MTKSSFRRRSEAAFRNANPDAVTATLDWQRCEAVKWADGSDGYSGSFTAAASGFRTRTMLATIIDGSLMVR